MRSGNVVRLALSICLAAALSSSAQTSPAQRNNPAATAVNPGGTAILTAAETAKVMPATVFFRGQSAPIQARNSAGVRLDNAKAGEKDSDRLMLIALIDTSGYASQIQNKYQAYLITESPLTIDGHTLPPGAYGCGFVANDSFLIMDLGAHDLFSAKSVADSTLKRPRPLQIIPTPSTPGSYRLYVGRSYITFAAAP